MHDIIITHRRAKIDMPGENNETDVQLLRELVVDLDTGFERLVYCYHASLLRFVCHSQSLSTEDAEDILQECWVKIYGALGRYAHERLLSLKLRSWLFTIVHNESQTYIKKEKKITRSAQLRTAWMLCRLEMRRTLRRRSMPKMYEKK